MISLDIFSKFYQLEEGDFMGFVCECVVNFWRGLESTEDYFIISR